MVIAGHKAHKRCLLGFGRSFVGEGGPRIELNSFPMPPSGVAAPVSLRAPSIQRNFFRNLCAAVLPFVAATMNRAEAVAQTRGRGFAFWRLDRRSACFFYAIPHRRLLASIGHRSIQRQSAASTPKPPS